MPITKTFDTNTDSHVAWFDATVVRTTADTHSGAGALSWTANAAFSGVDLSNFPYFTGVTAGETLECSVWTKGASGSYDTSINWTIKFYNEAGSQQGSSTNIVVAVGASWAQSTPQQIVVPTGATRVGWTFDCNSAGTGSVILIDDIEASAPALTPAEGSASGSLAFAGTAVGKRSPQGSAGGTLAYAGAAVGLRQPKGVAGGTLSLTGSAIGVRQPVATATGTLAWSGAAVGRNAAERAVSFISVEVRWRTFDTATRARGGATETHRQRQATFEERT